MVVILNLLPHQFFLSVDEGLRSVVSLRVVECFVNGELLGFCTLLLLSLWLVQRKILGLLFDVEVLNRPAGPVYVNHFEVAVCHEEQFANFLALVYEHLAVGQNVLLEGRHQRRNHHLGRLLEYGRFHEGVQLLLEVVFRGVRDEFAVKSVGNFDGIASMRRSVHFSVV
jgi:hypothetical protein